MQSNGSGFKMGAGETPNDDVSDGGRRVRFGPGLWVTAAFIGPGTVVTASKAGAGFGCELLWTIVLACVGTIVLQSLAARVGILSRHGLGESIRQSFAGSRWRSVIVALVVAAIGVGNAAYQTGNFTGAVAGIRSLSGSPDWVWLIVLVGITCTMIFTGGYRVVQFVLVGLVVLLSLSFLGAACWSMPPVSRLVDGLLIPRIRADRLTLILALIGTTIVPYNLFLHASRAATTWQHAEPSRAIRQSDWDTILSVSLGGLVTASILITADAAFCGTQRSWTSTRDIANQLEPTLGPASRVAFAIGLFAAGLTSSITAPMATAYAVCGCLGWTVSPTSWPFRTIATSVIFVGGAVALLFGQSPSATIIFSQVANGLLLPVVAVFLFVVVAKLSSKASIRFGTGRKWLAGFIIVAVALLGTWRMVITLR